MRFLIECLRQSNLGWRRFPVMLRPLAVRPAPKRRRTDCVYFLGRADLFNVLPGARLGVLVVKRESQSKRLLKSFKIAIIIRATCSDAIKYSAVGARS